MSCNPPCCKIEPDGRCPYCYSDQEWAMQLPPDDIIRVAEGAKSPGRLWGRYLLPDLLKDGTGDAVLGECGSRGKRDGSDGYDSHTYVGSARDYGFEENVPRTEVGDSIPRPIPTLDNIITNQIIGDKLYGITRVRPRKLNSLEGTGGQRTVAPFSEEGVEVWGRFHVPDWVFLDKSYKKTGKFRFGLDRAGPDELWDRPKDNEWHATLGDQSRYYNGNWAHRLQTFARCTFDFINGTGLIRTDTVGFTFLNGRLPFQYGGVLGPGPGQSTSIPVINNDGITNDRDFYGVSLNDRRVFMRLRDRRIGAYWPLLWDTGLTLGDVFDSGIFFEINVTQTDGPVVPDGSLDFNWHFDVTYRIPQIGFEIQEEKRVTPIRCFSGGIYLNTTSGYTRTYHNSLKAGPYEGVFKAEKQFDTFDVCNGDPSWWIDDVNAGFDGYPANKTIAALGWVQNLEVADGNFADTSYLVVRGFTHEGPLGELKKAVSYLDYDEQSIPSGETITIGDVANGDRMRLILDNPAEETVEVTAVTFDDPWLKTVSDSNPTLLPYTVVNLLFTVDHTVATGTVDITLTHDANNEFIPSPWVITLDAELGGGGPPE